MSKSPEAVRLWLEKFLRAQGGVAGTVHRRRDDDLELVAAVNIPDPIQRAVSRVPRGKGMAGLAFERNRPVSTCNLKTDASGDVRPGARDVEAQAAVAIPVEDAVGEVRAVVGIAFRDERELGETETEALRQAAQSLPE